MVVWVLLLDLVQEEVVNQVYDLQVAGEDSGDDVCGPPLQELMAGGMRGVREGLTSYQPGLMKGEILLINKDSH